MVINMKTNKFKNLKFLTLLLCLVSGISTTAFARGTLYSGQTYDYATGKSGAYYSYHLSASANIDSAPNKVVANGFAMSTYPIERIQATMYIFKNDYTRIASGYDTRYNSSFASAIATYSGWPAGTSYCYASGHYSFRDSYYGNFLADDYSTNLYW